MHVKLFALNKQKGKKHLWDLGLGRVLRLETESLIYQSKAVSKNICSGKTLQE
jgi:hypothetical protein